MLTEAINVSESTAPCPEKHFLPMKYFAVSPRNDFIRPLIFIILKHPVVEAGTRSVHHLRSQDLEDIHDI